MGVCSSGPLVTPKVSPTASHFSYQGARNWTVTRPELDKEDSIDALERIFATKVISFVAKQLIRSLRSLEFCTTKSVWLT